MNENEKRPGVFHNPDGSLSHTKVMAGVGAVAGVASFLGGGVALLLGNPAGAQLMTKGIYLFIGSMAGRQVKNFYDRSAYRN